MIVLAGLLSCSQPARNSVFSSDVVYVNGELKECELLEELPAGHLGQLDLPGLMDVKVWDDFLLFCTKDPNGYIKVFDIYSGHQLGGFLLKGNGPGELTDIPYFSDMYFERDIAYINDSKGGINDWNIRKSCETGKTMCSVNKVKVPDSNYLLSIIPINEDALACVEIVGYGLNRYLYKGGERIVLPAQRRLNDIQLSAKDGFRFNMLFGFAVYDKQRGRIVEASTMLNTINIYDLDGNFSKTVFIGETPDEVSEIEILSLAEMPLSFQSLRSFDNGFGIIYYGDDQILLDSDTSAKPAILLFDWDGNMTAGLRVPVWITSFDIDWTSKTVYAVDYKEEKIFRFSMPHSLIQFP